MRGHRIRATAASLGALVWLVWLGALAGCSFKSPAAGADAPAGDDGALDDATDGGYTPACLTDATYVANVITGHRYKVLASSVNYDAAIDQCTANGAHLAVLNDSVESSYVAGQLGLLGGEGWIGYDDLTEEGTFRWITGATSTFNNFTGSDPNDNNNEDCTNLRPDGTWHDAGCENSYHPICECDPAYRPPPTPACRTMTASSFEMSGRRVFRGPAATWAAAKAACEAIGAHLLVIGDLAENGEMDGQLAGAHWLGYTDAATESTFVWVNGAPTVFKGWPGGTVPLDDTLDCAVLQDGGAWADLDCATTNPYACECDPAPP
jgi:hypothetical protein